MEEFANEILEFTLSKSTLEIVNLAFESKKEIYPIDCSFVNFRLLMVSSNIINLEYSVKSKFGMSFEVSGQFHDNGQIFLPLIFFKEFKKNNSLNSKFTNIYNFPILDDALIAAHSIRSLLIIAEQRDWFEIINGVQMEFYISDTNMINIFANDRYGLNPSIPLASGLSEDGRYSVNSTIQYDNEYRRMVNLQLLSIAKIF